ncbi:SET domain-containing protein [Massilia atriviolacea]|uniref:SET domain-containing protein n=1 Tax=Massilia atriviolacea TaxID=2495579 RepID=A0A430HK70_9BURK|nr:SET domain-containing protein-lysine N-methyltransferase [Massilia atriviolacea]RSZ57928.1 SET domain-containing protein [Massilia atriviolacea]
MKTTPSQPSSTEPACFEVRRSTIHGNGVFATRDIDPGEQIVEYTGERITADESAERAEAGGGPVNHTFFFSLADGMVIDGGRGGNDSRFINHSCEPNCEAQEDEGRVFIYALHPIMRDEELKYNYALIYEERHTPAVKKAFECRCGAPTCSGTMLAPKKRKRARAG